MVLKKRIRVSKDSKLSSLYTYPTREEKLRNRRRFEKRFSKFIPIIIKFAKDLKRKRMKYRDIPYILHYFFHTLDFSYASEIEIYDWLSHRLLRQEIINDLAIHAKTDTLEDLITIPKEFLDKFKRGGKRGRRKRST